MRLINCGKLNQLFILSVQKEYFTKHNIASISFTLELLHQFHQQFLPELYESYALEEKFGTIQFG